MTYSIEDVNAAARLVRKYAPTLVIDRSDYDFGLSIANVDRGEAIVLFRPERPERPGVPEISSTAAGIKAAILKLR